MLDLTLHILTPTVVAAVVSAVAMLLREQLASRARRREVATGNDLQRHGLLLQQIELLFSQNARLREREQACEQRQQKLERRCADLERRCAHLRRRIEALTRLVASARRPPRKRMPPAANRHM